MIHPSGDEEREWSIRSPALSAFSSPCWSRNRMPCARGGNHDQGKIHLCADLKMSSWCLAQPWLRCAGAPWDHNGTSWQRGPSHSSQHCVAHCFLYHLERVMPKQPNKTLMACAWATLYEESLRGPKWQWKQCPLGSSSTDPASSRGGEAAMWVQKSRNTHRGVQRVHTYLLNSHSSRPQMGLSSSSKHCSFP